MDDNPGTPTLADLRRQWHRSHAEPVLLRLTDACRKRGLLNEALAVLREGVRRKPRRLAPRVALGRCLLEAGELAAAAEILGGVVDQDPTQLVASKLLVEVHLAREDVDQAALRLDLYGLLNPGDPALGDLKGRLRAARRRERHTGGPIPERKPTRPAAAVARSAAPATPRGRLWTPAEEKALFPGGGTAGGAAYWSTVAAGPFGGGVRRRVEPAAVSAPAGPPSSGESTATLGRLYLQQGHPHQAARIFRRVLDRDPTHRAAQEGMSAVVALSPPRLRATDLLAAAGVEGGDATGSDGALRSMMLKSYLVAVLERA